MCLASFLCLRAWMGPDGKGAGFGSTKGAVLPIFGAPPPPAYNPPNCRTPLGVTHLLAAPPMHKAKQGTRHRTPGAVPPVTGTAGRHVSSSYSPWRMRTAIFGAAAGCTATALRGPKTVSPAPISQQVVKQRLAPGPLTHSQFVLKHVCRIGTNRGTPTPHTLPPKHTILV